MQGNKKTVTVIIPAYSRPELLIETIDSIYRQKGALHTRVIVVDDHSPTPLGPAIKRKHPEVKVIRNKINLKSGPARNVALRFIDTEYVAFLDADDIWHEDFLRHSINNIEESGSIGSIALSTPMFYKRVPPTFKIKILTLSFIRDFFQILFYIFNSKNILPSAFYLCQLSHLLFKAEAIRGISFDPNYNFGGEDWKFILEVMDKGSFRIVPRRLVQYRYHNKSTSFMRKNRLNKWNSYKQLFNETRKRHLSGIMIVLFAAYIKSFQKRS